jgi:hypothetical protein
MDPDPKLLFSNNIDFYDLFFQASRPFASVLHTFIVCRNSKNDMALKFIGNEIF